MSEKPAYSLWEKISNLRMASSMLYDRARIGGATPEKIAKEIEPLSQILNDTILKGVQDDFAGVVFSLHALEHQAQAHEMDAKFLLTKAADCRHHAGQIRKHLLDDMKAKGLKNRADHGCHATISVAPSGAEVLTVR